ncbi:MAG: putative porin [Crocinitomicaceae bacterium]|nr:putative porin [Crocinitomicaceae bacterium]
MKKLITLSLAFFCGFISLGQSDSTETPKLSFNADFRFRFEQDWNNRNQDSSYTDPRSRFWYRARWGMKYSVNTWADFGMRIRTGVASNPQDPQDHLRIERL